MLWYGNFGEFFPKILANLIKFTLSKKNSKCSQSFCEKNDNIVGEKKH